MLLGAGVGLSMLASQPHENLSPRMTNAQTNESDAPAFQDEAMSLAQFMSEHNLTLRDNLLAKKSPRRLTAEELTGPRIISYEMHEYDFETGNTGEQFQMGIIADAEATEDEGMMVIPNFYGPAPLPFRIDVEEGGIIPSGLVRTIYRQLTAPDGDNIVRDTLINYYVVPEAWISVGRVQDPNYITGYMVDDGSIGITDDFVFLIETITRATEIGCESVCDTTLTCSPLFTNTLLLVPNGKHDYSPQKLKNYSFDPSILNGVGRKFGDINLSLIIDGSGTMGYGGRKPVKPGNGGGSGIDWTRPGDEPDSSLPSVTPKSNAPSPDGNGTGLKKIISFFRADLSAVATTFFGKVCDPTGFGGRKPPVKPGADSGNFQSWTRPSDNPRMSPPSAGDSDDNGIRPKGFFLDASSLVHLGSKIDVSLIKKPGNGNETLGIGGRKPIKPGNSGGSGIEWTRPGDNPNLSLMSHPAGGNSNVWEQRKRSEYVYMYQVDDTTLYVHNLYGKFGMNYMIIRPDGTMSFPFQAVGDDYNYTCPLILGSASQLQQGCTGNVSAPNEITWGRTMLTSDDPVLAEYVYDRNSLYFTNGGQFQFNPTLSITSVTQKLNRMCNGEEEGTITDVTTMLNRLLYAK